MQENKKGSVDIVDFRFDVFNEMLKFIYTNKQPKYGEMTADLLAISDKYQLDRLKKLCELKLYKHLSIENVITTLVLADMYAANQLKFQALKFLRDHANEVYQLGGFKELGPQNFLLAKEILQQIAIDDVNNNEVNYLWEVKNFLCESVKFGEFILSPEFEAFQNKWYLKLYPNGKNQKNENHLSLTLHRTHLSNDKRQSNPTIMVSFSFSIMTKDHEKTKEITRLRRFDKDIGYGFESWIPLQYLYQNAENLIPNNNLIINCRIKKLYSESDRDVAAASEIEFIDSMKKLLSDQKFGDFTFKIDGKELKVYKGILAVQSGVFAEIFESANESNGLEIDGISYDVFQDMMNFVYTNMPLKFSNNIEELFKLAYNYQLKRLKWACQHELIKKLSIENAVNTLLIADQYSAMKLREKAINFMSENFQEIEKTDNYVKIERSHFHLVLELLEKMAANTIQNE